MDNKPSKLYCKTYKAFKDDIQEFLEIFGFKDCREAYEYINNRTLMAFKYYEKALHDYSIISDHIVNMMIPKESLNNVKQKLGKWVLKVHKKVDPTIPNQGVVLLINYYYSLYIAYTDFLVLTELEEPYNVYNKKEMIGRLVYMFYVKRFLTKLRGKTTTYINKDKMNRVIQSFRTSHNFRKFDTVHDAILNDSMYLATKLIEKVYNEKHFKYIHTFWSSTVQPKAVKYAITLKDRYIKAMLTAQTSRVDYDTNEKHILDKYHDAIHSFILEKEPIDEIVDYVLHATNRQVSKELLVRELKRVHNLNKKDIENMVKDIVQKLDLKALDITENIKKALREKTRILYYPINDELQKEVSLQTLSNLKYAVYLYLIVYLAKDSISDIQTVNTINTSEIKDSEDLIDIGIW